jgi:hypothetical protein
VDAKARAEEGLMEFNVRAFWDAEASVWVAEGEDVPGLVTEAEDLEGLLNKLRVLIPELLEANGVRRPDGTCLEDH